MIPTYDIFRAQGSPMHSDHGHKRPPPIIYSNEGWQPPPRRSGIASWMPIIENVLIVIAVTVALTPVFYGLYSWANAAPVQTVLPRR